MARAKQRNGARHLAGQRDDNKRATKRLEILRSAAGAFRRHGYHGASMGLIARALGMSKGNLYYYFRSKEDILYFCHDYSLGLLLGLLRGIETSTRPPRERLRELILAFVHMIIDELHGVALTLDLQPLSSARLRKIIAKRDRFDRGLRQILREGMDTGDFRRGNVKLVSFAILGAVNWIARWYNPRGPARSAEVSHLFADFLIAGLRPSRRSASALDDAPLDWPRGKRGRHADNVALRQPLAAPQRAGAHK